MRYQNNAPTRVDFSPIYNHDAASHLDSGSKDKVNKILENEISIPALCWWRDDISRIIEKDPIFMWSYPEILNGQDVLNLTLFQNINESKERRESIIRAYLADQYSIDNEVKFRQIDLQNRLLDLFTDVPIKIKKLNEKNKELRRAIEFMNITNTFYLKREIFHLYAIHNIQITNLKILLEGGPGQGKSTISQYICQIHRARLLDKVDDLKLVPESIKQLC